jgi:hypothetical protein
MMLPVVSLIHTRTLNAASSVGATVVSLVNGTMRPRTAHMSCLPREKESAGPSEYNHRWCQVSGHAAP